LCIPQFLSLSLCVCVFVFSSLRRGLASASPPSSFCDLRRFAVINVRTNTVDDKRRPVKDSPETQQRTLPPQTASFAFLLSFVHTFAAALAIDSERCATPF